MSLRDRDNQPRVQYASFSDYLFRVSGASVSEPKARSAPWQGTVSVPCDRLPVRAPCRATLFVVIQGDPVEIEILTFISSDGVKKGICPP